MKHFRTAVALLASAMLLSACGNNGAAENSGFFPLTLTTEEATTTGTTSETAARTQLETAFTTTITEGEEDKSDNYYDSIDYYSLYDPINNRTNYVPGDGVIVGADNRAIYLVFGDPNWMDPYFYFKLPNANRYLYTENIFMLNNKIFYYTSESSIENILCGLSYYDRSTGNSYSIVPANEDMPYSGGLMGRTSFMLSNDCKIYGMIPSYKKQPVQSADGTMSVDIVYNWNLIKINDDYSGYEVIKVLEPDYDYVFCGIYDNKIYLEKYTMKKLIKESRFGSSYSGGDFLGLYTYDIDNDTETKILDSAPCRNGGSSIYSFKVLEYQGKRAIAYAGWDDLSRLYIKIEDNDWQEIYSSANQFWFGMSNVQYTNNKFYIPLNDYSGNTMYFSADTTGSDYVGIADSRDDSKSIVIENNITGRTQYVNSKGSLLDFE